TTPIASSLRTPVSVVMGDAQFFGRPDLGEVVYVLSAGTIDPATGFLIPGTGRLSAFSALQGEIVLAEQLDSPLKMQFLDPMQLVIATQTQLLGITAGPCRAQCPGDWNRDGMVNSQDFFDFLGAFFAVNADFNHDGVTNSQDLFDFVGAFFAGC